MDQLSQQMVDSAVRNENTATPSGEGVQADPDPQYANNPWATNPGTHAGSIEGFQFANPDAFVNPDTAGIYDEIRNGMLLSQQQTPILGPASQANAASLAPQQMIGGAQIAPQMLVNSAQMGTQQDLQYAAQQADLYNALRAQMEGQGQSVAATQAKQQAEQGLQQQYAMMASQRGGALGARQAMQAGAQAQQQAASLGALGKSQEAIAAGQQATSLLGQARGQGQAFGTTQTQLQQQALLANQGVYNNAALQQASLNQQSALANQQTSLSASGQNASLLQQAALSNQGAINANSLSQAQLQQQQQAQNEAQFNAMLTAYQQQAQQNTANQISYEQLVASSQLGLAQAEAGVDINDSNNMMGMSGAAIAAAGSMAAAALSDERLKFKIRSAPGKLRAFLETWRTT